MVSPVSPNTHKTFQSYTPNEVAKILELLNQLQKRAETEKAFYHADTYKKHLQVNTAVILANKRAGTSDIVQLPGDILFWLQRSCKHFSIPPPVKFPHICKLKINGVEHFFVTTKEDWLKHKNATTSSKVTYSYTDHATLGYLSRVVGLDIEGLMVNAPMEELMTLEGEILADGRKVVEHQNHLYLIDGTTCISVLNAGMSVR